jgi:hypothetical protein
MGRQRSLGSEFGVQASARQRTSRRPAGLHEFPSRHSHSRNLIRLWNRRYEAGEFTD